MLDADIDLPDPNQTALFLDVDGTMIDFARTPAEVRVPSGLLDDIAAIERALDGALAVISGRTLADIDRLFDPLRLRASGVHGAEMRYDPARAVMAIGTARELSPHLWRSLNEMLQAFPGAFAENKRFSFAVHYRAAPELGPALFAALRRLVAPEGSGDLQIFAAHLAFEIKRHGFDKGGAIEQFLECEPFVGRVPIFIGDDLTDEAGFETVARRGGAAYSVGEVRPRVRGVFPDPSAVRAWLARSAHQMSQS
jgi:trehalose 6-phosphate phosphatase